MNICGAKTRGGTPCKLRAGQGTDHFGTGRCKFHGGASKGAKKGNKNAVKTGEYETIWLDQLTDEERELYNRLDTEVAVRIETSIRLVEIRERRMLERIASLKNQDMTVVEEITEEPGEEITGGEGKGDTTKRTKKAGTLGQIQAIEEALTRVAAQKAKLIELKHRIGLDSGDDEALKALAESIAKLKANVKEESI